MYEHMKRNHSHVHAHIYIYRYIYTHVCTNMHAPTGDDEMYDHMKRNHFHCGICQAAGNPHLYFA